MGGLISYRDTEWEQQAENWVRWARSPNHDGYWNYRDSFFDHIVPPPGRSTIEIGCGEGRVARDLVRRGHRVTALDLSPTLLRHARSQDPIGTYLLADAAALPFADGSVDLVVSYNALMDVNDMPAAVLEAARVIEPGGRFCTCVTHPVNDAGQFTNDADDAPFIIAGSYLGQHVFEGAVERDGLTMTFRGWSYPLEDYARAFEQAGLLIETIREPVPDSASLHHARRLRIPAVLHLRALKPFHHQP